MFVPYGQDEMARRICLERSFFFYVCSIPGMRINVERVEVKGELGIEEEIMWMVRVLKFDMIYQQQ